MLSTEYKKTAEMLSEYISWRGRYVLPTDKSLKDIIPIKINGRPIPGKTITTNNTITTFPAKYVSIEEARDLIDYIVSQVKLHLYNE